MGFLDAVDLVDRGQEAGGDGVVEAEHHHGVAPHDAPAHLHRGDVHVVLAQQRAQLADDAGHVAVAGEQHVAAGRHVHRELIDGGDPQFAVGEHRSGHAVAALGAAAAQLQRATGKVAAGVVLYLEHMDAPLLGLQAGIHIVDAVPQGGGEHPLQGRHHQGLSGVGGEIALQPHLKLADLAPRQLAEQLPQDFRQLQVWLELLHDLGVQAWDVHGAAGRQAEQHVADLLGHVDGHILLGLLGGGAEVGGEDQPLLHAAQR